MMLFDEVAALLNVNFHSGLVKCGEFSDNRCAILLSLQHYVSSIHLCKYFKRNIFHHNSRCDLKQTINLNFMCILILYLVSFLLLFLSPLSLSLNSLSSSTSVPCFSSSYCCRSSVHISMFVIYWIVFVVLFCCWCISICIICQSFIVHRICCGFNLKAKLTILCYDKLSSTTNVCICRESVTKTRHHHHLRLKPKTTRPSFQEDSLSIQSNYISQISSKGTLFFPRFIQSIIVGLIDSFQSVFRLSFCHRLKHPKQPLTFPDGSKQFKLVMFLMSGFLICSLATATVSQNYYPINTFKLNPQNYIYNNSRQLIKYLHNSNSIDSFEQQYEGDNGDDEDDSDKTAYPAIKALVNRSVGLPCNISQTKEENSIKLILWYKNNILGSPIYSIDARDTNISSSRHFVAPSYRERASFELSLSSRTALLFVKPLLAEDDGHYICRVDFRWTRTTISTVKLDVIVPPQKLRLIQVDHSTQPRQDHPNRHMQSHYRHQGTSSSDGANKNQYASSLPPLHRFILPKEMHRNKLPNNQNHKQNSSSSSNNDHHQRLYPRPNHTSPSMINYIRTVQQPEETVLSLYCDSIGGKPNSIVKWYRLVNYEHGSNHQTNQQQKPIDADELYTLLELMDEKMLELIDDSCYEMNVTEKQQTAEAEQKAIDEGLREVEDRDDDEEGQDSGEENFMENLKKYESSWEDRSSNSVNNGNVESTDSHVTDSKRIKKKKLKNSKNQNKDNGKSQSAIRSSKPNLVDLNLSAKHGTAMDSSSVSAIVVRNELKLGTIYGSNHGQLYLCRTSNSNLTKPLDMIVQLEIYTRPKSIQIRQQLPSKKFYPHPPPPPHARPSSTGAESVPVSKLSAGVDGQQQNNRTLHSIELLDYYLNANQPPVSSSDFNQPKQPFRLRSGFEFEFICQTNGSYPAANISWFLKEYQTNLLKDITPLSYASYSDHDTLSLLQFVPKFTDNKARLICRAYNQIIRNLQQTSASSSHSRASVITSASSPSFSNQRPLQKSSPFDSSSQSLQSGQTQLHYQVSGASSASSPSLSSSASISALFQNQDQLYQLETSVPLDVNYPPIVSIQVLSGEQMFHEVEKQKHQARSKPRPKLLQTKSYHQFVEMQEIFFNCSVNSNPDVYIVQWFFNDKILHTDLSQGIIITNLNRTLIISAATRKYSGHFYCRAANILGDTASEKHQIDILFKPQCLFDFVQINYHQLGDFVWLKCQIVANPIENLKFTWKFNGTTFLGGDSSANVASSDVNDSVGGDGSNLSADLYGTQDANQSLSSSYSVVEHTVSAYDDSDRETSRINNEPDKKMKSSKNHDAHNNDDRSSASSKELQQWGLVTASSTTTTHSATHQQHLITNVVQIQLKQWNSFGHFSCQSGNQVGQQSDACKWHVVPATVTTKQQQQHRHHGTDYVLSPEHFNSADNSMNPHHPFRVESSSHQHHQQKQQHLHRVHHQSRQHSKASPGSSMASTLNNCQIIESSNAVVIKCRHSPDDLDTGHHPNGPRDSDAAAADHDSLAHLLASSEDSPRSLDDSDRYSSSSSASSFPSSRDDTTNDNLYRTNSAELDRDLLSQFPLSSRVTYHVQVFELPDIVGGSSSSGRFNGSLVAGSKSDWNINLLPSEDNGAEQHKQHEQQQFSHQIDQNSELEPDKRIASKSGSSSFVSSMSSSPPPPPATPNVSTEPVLLFDTVNFTNPLFIITNLSASTTYLLKIWSSKVNHLDSMIEQVNITVRTRPTSYNDNDLLTQLAGKRKFKAGMSGTLATLLQIGNDKLSLLLGLIALVSFVFVSLTLTYAAFKIRAILDIRKARRDLNVNESINAFETALCEMRPETLETDLKSKNVNYSTVLDTFRPYVNVVPENCGGSHSNVMSAEQNNNNDSICQSSSVNLNQSASAVCSTLNCNLPDSSLIKYQNYLYPSATLPTGTIAPNGSIRVNCSDEESISTQNTSASNRSMLTSTTDSTIAANNLNHYPASDLSQTNPTGSSHHHHQYTNHCFQSAGVSLDTSGCTNAAATTTTANVIFCMDSGDGSNSGHAFIVPDSYHQYPLQLQIVPENGQQETTTMVEQFGSSIEIASNCITPSRSKQASNQFHLPQLPVSEIKLSSVCQLANQNDNNNNSNKNGDQLSSQQQQQSSMQTAV